MYPSSRNLDILKADLLADDCVEECGGSTRLAEHRHQGGQRYRRRLPSNIIKLSNG
jgi:hypothetical protein